MRVAYPPLSMVPVDYNRYSLVDDWRRALDDWGFVVLTNVLSGAEVKDATSLLWDYLEERTWNDRRDSATWIAWPKESFLYGMVQHKNASHCNGVWYVRGLQKVRKVFAELFATDDLHCSFDGFLAIRKDSPEGPYRNDWYHIDQPFDELDTRLVQGVVALTDSCAWDGGTVVWPCSHRKFAGRWGNENRTSHGFEGLETQDAVDSLPKDGAGLGPVKLCVNAGDLVLWDSRTVHCNVPPGKLSTYGFPRLQDLSWSAAGNILSDWSNVPTLDEVEKVDCGCHLCTGDFKVEPSAELARLAVYVCMRPSRLTTMPPEEREKLIKQRVWTGHVPFRDMRNDHDFPDQGLPEALLGCKVRRKLAGLGD